MPLLLLYSHSERSLGVENVGGRGCRVVQSLLIGADDFLPPPNESAPFWMKQPAVDESPKADG